MYFYLLSKRLERCSLSKESRFLRQRYHGNVLSETVYFFVLVQFLFFFYQLFALKAYKDTKEDLRNLETCYLFLTHSEIAFIL